MRTVPSGLYTARALLASDQAWLTFVEVPRKAGGFYRLVDNTRHVQSADGRVWQAASILVELPDEEPDGSQTDLSLTIPNVSRLPMAAVEAEGELLGQVVKVWMAHQSNAFAFSDGLAWQHRIVRVRADESAMTVECGPPDVGLLAPSERFDRRQFPGLLPAGGIRV